MNVLIGLTTWVPDDKPERLVYLHRTLEALKAHLWTSGCDVQFVVGCEHTNMPLQLTEKVIILAERFGWRIHWHESAPMLARNIENIWSHFESEFYFNMQDDWLLRVPLHLAEEVRFLQEHPELGVIRYRWKDKGLYMGQRVGDYTFLDPKGPAKKGYFGHSPYLARRTALEEIRPLDPKEIRVSEAAVHASFKVAVHHPPMFLHIGEKTTIHGNKIQPVEAPESWVPDRIRKNREQKRG